MNSNLFEERDDKLTEDTTNNTDVFWHNVSTKVAEFVVGLIFIFRGLYIFVGTIVQTDLGTVSILDSMLNIILNLIFIIISIVPIYVGCVFISASKGSESPIDIITIHKDKLLNSGNVQKCKIITSILIIPTFLILLSPVITNLGHITLANLPDINSSSFRLKREVDFGDILTPFTIGISAAVFLYGWQKDQQQNRKEYADAIRGAASMTTAKLERWRELFLCFFDDLNPLIIETDIILAQEHNFEKSRDYFVKKLMRKYSSLLQKILDENIEVAYKDLGGYDENLENRCYEVLKMLRSINILIYECIFYEVQRTLEDFYNIIQNNSAYLDNTKPLMSACERISKIQSNRNGFKKAIKQTACAYDIKNIVNMYKVESDGIISDEINAFHEEIKALIVAQDNEIAAGIEIFSKHDPGTHLISGGEGLTQRYRGVFEKSRYSFEMSLYTHEKDMGNNENATEHRKKAEYHYEKAVKIFEESIEYYENVITETKASPGIHAGKGLSQKALASLYKREADYKMNADPHKSNDHSNYAYLDEKAYNLGKNAEKEFEDALSGYMEKNILEKVSYIHEKDRNDKR